MIQQEADVARYVRQIHETLGPGNRCLGKDERLNFPDGGLDTFLQSLSKEDRRLLNRTVVFFKIHMEAIYNLIDENESNPRLILASNTWALIALSLIFSILDVLTKDHHKRRLEFTEFLKQNLSRIKQPQDIDTLSKEHAKENPTSSVRRFTEFYAKFLSVEEQGIIVRDYMREERKAGKLEIEELQDVINHLHTQVRSGFLHAMNIMAPSTEPYTVSGVGSKERPISFGTNLSPSHLLYLTWKAIFKSFGYNGKVDDKYTEAEHRNGVSASGRKLRWG